MAASKAFAKGSAANERREYAAAMVSYRTATSLWERSGYRGHDYVAALINLANCANVLRDPQIAVTFAERAFAVFGSDAKEGTDGLRLRIECLSARGNALSMLGRPTEAIASYDQLLPLAKRAGDSPGISRALTCLALECQFTGEFERGLLYLQQAESLGAKASTSSELLTRQSFILETRARLQSCLGDFNAALSCFRAMLDIEERLHGHQSERVAVALTLMGATQVQVGNPHAALATLDSAAPILQSLGLANTLSMADVYFLRGCLLGEPGMPLEHALDQYQRALAIRRALLPPNHPNIASLHTRIAAIHQLTGRHAAADAETAAAKTISRRSQTACAGPGCTKKLRSDGKPLDVCINQLPLHVLLREGLSDRRLEGWPQGGV